MIKNKSKIIVCSIIFFLFLSVFSPILNANSNLNNKKSKEASDIDLNLPDLIFLSIKSWWGYTNTSGIFVDYDIINRGDNYSSLLPIESNLTFFSNGNNTPFGYIIQKPLLHPHSWYRGEILGGNFFFDMDEKPDNITVIIDYTNLIIESDENNNNITANVENGIQLSGKIYKKIDEEFYLLNDTVEFNQFNETSLNDFGFRHFWSNEYGEYNMSLCPKDPIDDYHIYGIKACFLSQNIILIKNTLPVKSGENITLDFIFEGNPPQKPINPIGSKISFVNRNVTFLSKGSDNDSDKLFYKFSWGDGEYSDWIGPIESENIVITKNFWDKPDKYNVNVIVKDSNDILSEWSDDSTITIIDNFNIDILSIIEKIISSFIDII